VKLSPSAIDRWGVCTASPGAIEQDRQQGVALADESSPFAQEGTASHELLALSMLVRRSPREFIGATIRVESESMDWFVDEEMGEETEKTFEYVMDFIRPTSKVWIERKVSIGKALPGTSGTLDIGILDGTSLHVIDHKYGKGVPVSVKGNGQIRLYALGAMSDLLTLDERITLDEIVVHIAQPRLGMFTREVLTKGDIERFRLHVRDLYLTVTDPARVQFVPGEHCRFCPRKPYCKPLKESIYSKVFENMTPESFHDLKNPDRMTPEELAQTYSMMEFISAWTTNVKKYMEGQALRGTEYPGLKLVEGRKGARAWKDEDQAVEYLLTKGVEDDKIFKKVLVSPAQAENLIGRKKVDEGFKALVNQNEGKPILVSEEDPRPTCKQQLINEFED